MKPRGTVVLVDDDDATRDAVGLLLETEGYEVVSWGSSRAFVAAPLPGPPACVILDLNMPDLDGLQVQEHITDRSGLPILFLSGAATVATSVRAMKAGAAEFLEKPVNADELLDAVAAALEASTGLQAQHEDVTDARTRFESLTDRQREVLILASKGLTNGEIATALDITERTVKFHRQLAMRGMDLDSIAEFARLAERAGIC